MKNNSSKNDGSFTPISAIWQPQRLLKFGGLLSVVILIFLLLYVGTISWLQQEQPFDISPQEAHYNTEKWLGKQVKINGWLRKFEGIGGGVHYVLEDDKFNRLAIQNIPNQRLEEIVGQLATVEGNFQFDESSGIFIIATSITPFIGN